MLRSDSYLGAEWSDLFRRDHMPIDVIISPEAEVAKATLRRLRSHRRLRYRAVLRGPRSSSSAWHIHEDCPVINTPLRQLTELFSTLRCIVVAIRRDGQDLRGRGDDQVSAGDEIYFVAAREDVQRTFGIFGRENLVAERIVIVGAGNIGLRVAQQVEAGGHPAGQAHRTRPPRAEFAADHLQRTIVLNGDALNEEIQTRPASPTRTRSSR